MEQERVRLPQRVGGWVDVSMCTQEQEREEFNLHKRECEMEKRLMEEERARLLREHAPHLLGHLPPVCIIVDSSLM